MIIIGGVCQCTFQTSQGLNGSAAAQFWSGLSIGGVYSEILHHFTDSQESILSYSIEVPYRYFESWALRFGRSSRNALLKLDTAYYKPGWTYALLTTCRFKLGNLVFGIHENPAQPHLPMRHSQRFSTQSPLYALTWVHRTAPSHYQLRIKMYKFRAFINFQRTEKTSKVLSDLIL